MAGRARRSTARRSTARRSTARRSTATAGALLGCLSVLSCAHVPAAEAGPGALTPLPVVPPGLERFYNQKLGWGPCAPLATDQDQRTLFAEEGLDCARLEVPLDYAAPAGRTAQVAVLRQRTNQPDRIGSLVLDPGGPGGSGMSLAANLSGRLGGGPFDVVGFDPRGVGASTPRITCQTGAERDSDRADQDYDVSPAGVRRAEDKARVNAEQCTQRSGGADVLANSGTRDVARDLDVLRSALGDRQLTYLGYSYGTLIGSSYAELFPGNVRALVLDGAIDPSRDPVDSAVAQAAGFQKAFEVFAADCAGRPDCPLGTDPSRATAEFQALTRPLIEHPAPVRGGTRVLAYRDAVWAAIASMYSPNAWPQLRRGLTELRAGDGTTLMKAADSYFERAEDGTYRNDNDAQLVVNCVDGDRTPDRAVAAELDRRTSEAAPFTDSGRGALGALGTCEFLPVPPTGRPHTPNVPGLPPVLVISTTGDPATPYQAGVDLARALHGSLLTVEGTQHTAAAEGYACVDDIVADYLVRLRPPAEGARCRLQNP